MCVWEFQYIYFFFSRAVVTVYQRKIYETLRKITLHKRNINVRGEFAPLRTKTPSLQDLLTWEKNRSLSFPAATKTRFSPRPAISVWVTVASLSCIGASRGGSVACSRGWFVSSAAQETRAARDSAQDTIARLTGGGTDGEASRVGSCRRHFLLHLTLLP